ncbi:FKBP-type peptidyl-prolyl cis-trans isomerase [Kocuria sp. TGY1127_2]|uniref:FKBP-type peptidyl-prolyl cis-trans isomerase n=1 Tax=Kocuria sp. TGY1127_2 TaxID=2711328 RepID=UPI0015BD3213|nr:FKBP-type peptidyl-prolyl cis-trans isomerase [Kocuria sp. TGY1127_2]
MRKSLKLSAAAVVLTLALAGCGGGKDLDSVDFKDQGAGKAPSVSFDTPLSVNDDETRILKDGDGDEVHEGDTVLVDAAVFNGADQKSEGDTYSGSPITITVNDQLKEKLPKVYDILKDTKVGTSFAYAKKPSDEASGGASGSSEDASAVEVYTVSKKLPKSAEGDAVPPQEGLPNVTMKDSGPEIKIPEGQDEPKSITAQNLINGKGDEIKDDQKVYVHYSGVKWSDGQQFDSNWTKDPTGFQMDQVIKGWSEGLKGKKVGDRVLLEVPTDKAYGTQEQLGSDSQQPAGPLVFVVDILGTSKADPPQSSQGGTGAQQGNPQQ